MSETEQHTIYTNFSIFSKKKLNTLLMIFIFIIMMYQSNLQLNTKIRCTWVSKSEYYRGEVAIVKERLMLATSELEALKKQHNDLINLLHRSSLFVNNSNYFLRTPSPGLLVHGSIERYETVRRKMYSDTKDLGYYINYKLLEAIFEDPNPKDLRDFLDEINNRKRLLLSYQEKLPVLDGYEEWRRNEAHRVSDLIQRRLEYLQNPANCRKKQKVVSTMDKCGFGCIVHHMVYCLIFAYATERTLVIKPYNNSCVDVDLTNLVFNRLSKNCNSLHKEGLWQYNLSPGAKNVWLPQLRKIEKYLISQKMARPHYIPKDLAKRISRFNGDPESWWIGQFLKYLLRTMKKTDESYSYSINKLNISSPVVGIHIRRTDKLVSEATAHDICEYMQHVDEYYAQLELTRPVTQRVVYLATDDPQVIKTALANYPQYFFYYDTVNAEWASDNKKRFTQLGLLTVLEDLHSLASCDYLVCTFSSNICRLAYEMMQIDRDASNSVYSLDHFYYFSKSEPNYRVAIRNQIEDPNKPDTAVFNVGDIIRIQSWNQDKYVGKVLRTEDTGVIPSYKTVKLYRQYEYPQYRQVPIHEKAKNLMARIQFLWQIKSVNESEAAEHNERLLLVQSQGNAVDRCTCGSSNVYGVDMVAMLKHKIKQVTSELSALKKQHRVLIDRVRNAPRFVNNSEVLLSPWIPGLLINGSIEHYEALRRKTFSDMKKLGDFIHKKLFEVMLDISKSADIRDMLEQINKRKRFVLSDQQMLTKIDGYEEWRRKEEKIVSDLIQRRLTYIQHPADCRRRRKVICTINSCGFACIVHHLAHCLLFAYATDRTLLLFDEGWGYQDHGWRKLFQWRSNCTTMYGERAWRVNANLDAKAISLKRLKAEVKSRKYPKFRPYHVPEDLAKRIIRFNGNPASWWAGQIIKYLLLKPQPNIMKLIKHATTGIRGSHYSPKIKTRINGEKIVGVHVRRTDKIVIEAGAYNLSQYLHHVDEYYAQLELNQPLTRRVVYLATDEPRVLENDIGNYPFQYTFYYNYGRARVASKYGNRRKPLGLHGIIADLFSLASCDYVVCTFSSNVCRLVYELKQITGDASNSVYSLDHYYYYYVDEPHYRVAIRNQSEDYDRDPDLVSFRVGDIIKVYYTDQDKEIGTVVRNNDIGTVRWYRTVKIYETYPFPVYPQVPIYPTKTRNIQ